MSSPPSDGRIVVGIDFGTTFSGVAFIYNDGQQNFDKIDIVKRWPGSNNSTSEKVPTQLCYTQTGTVAKWGYEVDPAASRIQYIKLLLDSRQELPHWVSRTELDQQLKTRAKTATSAAADYLTKLHEMARTELVKRYGEDFVEATSIEYILTVPAVWSDAAKHATACAAQMAGLGENLRMISEPEAAAVYSLSTMKSSGLKVGDVYIVLDAGGGTVDLITYEVVQMKPLKFREVVTGSGRLCGGAFLNLRFQDLVKRRLGERAFRNLREQKPKAWAVAVDYFENYVKRNFLPSVDSHLFDDSKFNVPFPGVPDNVAAGIDCGFLTLSTAEVTEIFRPILDDIIGLVEHQRLEAAKVGAVAKGVILVGGFGQSSYLYACLKQRFADGAKLPKACVDIPPSYEHVASLRSLGRRQAAISPSAILQPENAWTAVVRGAVMRGLENEELVSSRKARRHYGFIVAEPWNDNVHDRQDKIWDEFHERWYAGHQML
ncbi:hypothetical protein MBLNU457_g0531t1 [Dothideomycetes sp. NU457]